MVTKMSYRDIPAGKIISLDEFLKTENKGQKEIRIFIESSKMLTLLSTAEVQVEYIELKNFKIIEGIAKNVLQKKGFIAMSWTDEKPAFLLEPSTSFLQEATND